MSETADRNGTQRRRGWLVAGLSLAVLFGIVMLKGGADNGGELD
jgi:hypothetical protein